MSTEVCAYDMSTFAKHIYLLLFSLFSIQRTVVWNETFGFADPLLSTPITLVFDVSRDNEPMLATFFYGDNAVKFSGDDKKELRKKEAIAGAQRLVGSDPTSPDERSFHPLSVV